MRAATIATLPHWMRDLAGVRQPAAVDRAVTPIMRAHFRAVARSTPAQLALLDRISPSTRAIVEPPFRNIRPLRDEVLTPAQARERHGRPAPRELLAVA